MFFHASFLRLGTRHPLHEAFVHRPPPQDAATGRVFVFSNTDVAACRCGVFRVASDDDGATWAAPAAVDPASGVVGQGLTHGVTHRATGRLVGCMRRICRNSCPAEYNSKAPCTTARRHQAPHIRPQSRPAEGR